MSYLTDTIITIEQLGWSVEEISRSHVKLYIMDGHRPFMLQKVELILDISPYELKPHIVKELLADVGRSYMEREYGVKPKP